MLCAESRTKRHRTLQWESLEDRNLLSGGAKLQTFHGQFTGMFDNVLGSSNSREQVYATTIQQQGTTSTLGPIMLTAHNTTTVTHHGKRGMVAFTHGTGTVMDALGDELTFSYSGRGPLTSATTFKFHETGKLTGATGPLSGATGHLTGTGVGDFTNNTVTLDVVVKYKA